MDCVRRNVESVRIPIAVALGPVGGPLASAFANLVVISTDGSGDLISSSFSDTKECVFLQTEVIVVSVVCNYRFVLNFDKIKIKF